MKTRQKPKTKSKKKIKKRTKKLQQKKKEALIANSKKNDWFEPEGEDEDHTPSNIDKTPPDTQCDSENSQWIVSNDGSASPEMDQEQIELETKGMTRRQKMAYLSKMHNIKVVDHSIKRKDGCSKKFDTSFISNSNTNDYTLYSLSNSNKQNKPKALNRSKKQCTEKEKTLAVAQECQKLIQSLKKSTATSKKIKASTFGNCHQKS